jgi:hypothetical protein
MGFPHNLAPYYRQPTLTPEQWAAQLAEAGCTGIRLKMTGRNRPLGTSAAAFEPTLGSFNPPSWRLDEIAQAFSEHSLGIHAIVTENEEFRADRGWNYHAWNVRNGGFLSLPTDALRPVAYGALHRRINAIIEHVGPLVTSWEVMAEQPNLPSRGLGLDWAQQQKWCDEVMVPWTQHAIDYIRSVHHAPISGGHVTNLGKLGEFKSYQFRDCSFDFVSMNLYGDQSTANKMALFRRTQEWCGKQLAVSQCAPWAIGVPGQPHDVAPHPKSKRLAWAVLCAEYGAINPWRWMESGGLLWPVSEWWGIAAQEMSRIGGITAQYAAAMDLSTWAGRGESWDSRVASAGLNLKSSWGDGRHVKVFLGWDTAGAHAVTISGLESADYALTAWDYLSGGRLDWSTEKSALDGRITITPPSVDRHTALYITQVDTIPPDPDPEPDPVAYVLHVRDSVGDTVGTVPLVVEERYTLTLDALDNTPQ